MPEFFVGQAVEYLGGEGNSIATGRVNRVTTDWVFVEFEPCANLSYEPFRSFNADGSVPGYGDHPDGIRRANARNGRLKPLEENDMPLEYPPEPVIGYGVFDTSGRVIPEAYAGETQVGYGIFNLPRSQYGAVSTSSADDPLLAQYLADAKKAWQDQCLAIDFNAVENKLEFLIGVELHYTWLYTDQFGTEVKFPSEIDPYRKRHQIVFDYSSDCMVTGLKTMTEVQEHIRDSAPIRVANVEGDKITLDDGFVFHMTSRYRENRQPVFAPPSSVKALLMRNLVSQRKLRDSTPNEPVPEAIAA